VNAADHRYDLAHVRRVAVVGAGAWGTTLGALACARGPTTLWAREPEVVGTIRGRHENRLFLPDFKLPADLLATTSFDEALSGADVVVVAVPAQHVRAVMAQAGRWVPADSIVVSVAKGIEARSSKRMTEVLSEELPHIDPKAIGVLAGPNLAREVIAGHPSATTVAFTDHVTANAIQARLSGPTFRVYTSTDVVGCEIGGAVKNVIAIAAGVADGLGCGMNTMAALVTRGLAELARLGVALGGDPLTFLGLAGNGDLIATCGSPLSRNHRAGHELATGSTVAQILGRMTSVAEGVATAPVIVDLAHRLGVEMPIAEIVTALLDERIAPRDAITALMGRQPRPELHGLDGATAGSPR
jgi:glycerol-3-phosphate dehydrogenase (NAD(P)+)